MNMQHADKKIKGMFKMKIEQKLPQSSG